MKKQKQDNLQLSLFDELDFEGEAHTEHAHTVNPPTPHSKEMRQEATFEQPKAIGTIPPAAAAEPSPTILKEWYHPENSGHPKSPSQSSAIPAASVSYDHSLLFDRLAKSDFRSSFHLKAKDKAYIQSKGLDIIRQHAADFVAKRLAPAFIPNDGKQTPMRGHPVFLAQHATGCCCRGCFYKWHHIGPGRTLTPEEQNYAVDVLMTWIEKEYRRK